MRPTCFLLFSVFFVFASGGRSFSQDETTATGGASLSGMVFLDANKNAVRDEGEQGGAAVAVDLLDEDGEFIARVVTGDDGTYSFTGLEPGIYFIRFEFNAGYGVRSRGITVGDAGEVFFTPVPFLYPNSVYNFLRLNLTNPASFRGEEVSSFAP